MNLRIPPWLILLFFLMNNSQANTDSLRLTLEGSRGIERVDILNQLAYKLNYQNPDEALRFTTEADSISRGIDYIKGIARAANYKAIVFKNTSRYNQAVQYLDTAEKYNRMLGDSTGMAAVYNTRGTVFWYLTDFEKAAHFYRKSYQIYLDLDQEARAAVLINNIALALSSMSNFRDALDYYFEALALHEKHNNQEGQGLTLSNIGIVYFNLGNLDKALEYYHKSLKIRQLNKDAFGIASCEANIGNALNMQEKYEEALPHFYQALEIFIDKKDRANEAMVYAQIGNVLLSLGQTKDALGYLNKALAINEKLGAKESVAYVQLDIAESEFRQGKMEGVLPKLKACRDIFVECGNRHQLSHVYELMSEYFEKTGNIDKALRYFRNASHISDSLKSIEADERIAASELRYQKAQDESRINRLMQEKEMEQLNAERNRQKSQWSLFFGLGLLILAAIVFYAYRMKFRLSKSLQKKNEALAAQSLQIEQQKLTLEGQNTRLKQLDKAKNSFFANIAHEFRTPLTLIQAPLEDFLRDAGDNLPEEQYLRLKLASKNTRKLQLLIDELLSLTRLRSGKVHLQVSEHESIAFLKRIMLSFQSGLSRKKDIRMDLRAKPDHCPLYFDAEKMEIVFNNLISNAIKAIDEEGEIVVALQDVDDFVCISVSDTGRGISKSDLPHIFDRFYRAGTSSLESGSSGIGLELSKELVELHKGAIHVESTEGKGSVFSVHIPKGKEHFSEEDLLQEKQGTRENNELPPQNEFEWSTDCQNNTENAFSVLVVEDQDEMRDYIAKELSDICHVRTAINGKQALQAVRQQMPDLVLSDLMMPEMDGLRLLQELRKHKETEDLLFLLLTAKNEDEDRLKSYELKADAYITKPFNSNELKVRVRNLLQKRKHLEEKFARKILKLDIEKATVASEDQEFLKKLRDDVMEHISDSAYGLAQLSDKACLGERQLRRRIKELTDLSPVEFIRQIRLQYAKTLLEKGAFRNIADTAYASGFNNPAYFSRMFRHLYQCSPQEYHKAKEK